MKQVLQNMSNGTTMILEAPAPGSGDNYLLINSNVSLISAGTERMLVDFGKANFIDKAKQQPEKVKMVLDKVKTDGLVTTYEAVKAKLDQPLPLGYSNVGVVHSVGKNVQNFKAGDRVVSNGPHADVVKVSKNLCAKIPDGVSDDEASFTVVASIGLQGIRLANPTMGEVFVVTGVGLIGLLTVQLLRAHGCRVLAIDFDQEKLELAKKFGAEICNLAYNEDPIAAGMKLSRNRGVDGVIITASTKSNDPVSQAAKMSRKKGRIILVGVTGLELNRSDFYEKELSFQVSCSYGPGRYDPEYETKGHDYPLGFVRWTQQRNFEAVLDMMASGLLNVKSLMTYSFDFEKTAEAYEKLTEDKKVLGILLRYNSNKEERHIKSTSLNETIKYSQSSPVLGIIGAGNYASRVLIPAFKKTGANLHSISTAGGISGVIHGKKLGFAEATTDTTGLISNSLINTIVIVTQHNTHASLVCSALNHGKNVFVEKPLAINYEELALVEEAYKNSGNEKEQPRLMVGFNRRFSPQIQKMKELLLAVKEPKSFIMTMNAGAIPAEHWTQDIAVGGGRIIGEACHFIDLMRFLAGSKIVSVQARRMGTVDGVAVSEDKAAIILGFEDGSFGTIQYLANGSSTFPKERIEVFANGKVLQLDNFRKLKGYGWKNFNKLNLWKQDKGQTKCCEMFLDAIKNGTKSPIAIEEIFEVARVSIDVAMKLREQS